MRLLIGICIGFGATIAMAHDGSDALAAWYRSLTTADGKSCCTMRDCAPAEARMKEGRWEVLIGSWEVGDPRWVAVPERAVLRPREPRRAANCLPDAERIYSVLRAAGWNLRMPR